MSARDSPLVGIDDALRMRDPAWSVEIGRPGGPGWIEGSDLRTASSGPFQELLSRIGGRWQTADRRTIAASFALRHGWVSALALAPYLSHGCVPDISLENISLKFGEAARFERAAIHEARGVMCADLRDLRSALIAQANPVVEALHAWSGFARRGIWGMFASSWGSQLKVLHSGVRDQRELLPLFRAFFAGDDEVARMQPRLHTVTCGDVTQIWQRRASCCRLYLLPNHKLCTSCPLVPQEERLARNHAQMQKQLNRC